VSTGTLLAGDQMEYRVGETVAEGGEGKVFRLADRDDVLAKVYHQPAYGQEAKLTYMVSICSKKLRHVAAWPLSRLRDATDETVGFVMESLMGWQPLHRTYQVRSRLETNPKRTWKHLVRIARNLAACVHHVHEAGFVVGDLNESNVLVSRDAMVKLIDVDSFQCDVGDRRFHCQVGKPELLAPELQGHNLDDLDRTQNHDDFSLAILLFEVLMFGRHPFAGRPKEEQEIQLEDAILNSWYPYSTRRPSPIAPPRGVTIDWLPEEVRDLFEDAFEPNASLRPTAHQWFSALKTLEADLRRCESVETHEYWRGMDHCPWCELENRWNVALFHSPLSAATRVYLDLDDLWSKIEAVPAPTFVEPPLPREANSFEPSKNVLMRLAATTKHSYVFWVMIFVNVTHWLGTGPQIGVFVAVLLAPTGLYAYYQRRYTCNFNKAKDALQGISNEWNRHASPLVFDARKQEYLYNINLLRNSDQRLDDKRNELIRETHKADLDAYLSRYSIRALEGVVTREKIDDAVRMNIRSAADISEKLAHRFPNGVQDKAFIEYVNWRRQLEAKFWETSSYRLTPHMEKMAIAKVTEEDSQIREFLVAAPESLSTLRDYITAAQTNLTAEAEQPMRVLMSCGPRVAALGGDSLLGQRKRLNQP
jgi:DNA-binding helix-hairpin-helix protein with protein kinase domain